MLYYLFQYLEKHNVPGAGVFEYISFRAGLAILISLIVSTIYGKKIIRLLQKKQIGETIRELGLEGQYAKKGTPTMGGLIIIGSILISTLLVARIENVYIILMLITTVWLGIIGFVDDYIKVFKKNKQGLSGKFKILGQVVLGIVVGLIFYFNENVLVRNKINAENGVKKEQLIELIGTKKIELPAKINLTIEGVKHTKKVDLQLNDKISRDQLFQEADFDPLEPVINMYITFDHRSTLTTIPFFKNNEFDYSSLIPFNNSVSKWLGAIVFVLIVIVIITAISNGANITDGLDGLATGTSSIIGVTLGIFAYLSGNMIFADYLNIMYIPYTGELVVFISAFIGASVGFLWYNSFPAQVFMGDTGSLTIGGIIAVFAIAIRKEMLIPILCGIFLIENFSVVLQVGYFKYTKRKYGEGRRIFKMAPLHHHYQKKGYTEPKIVARFWIIGILLAVISIITLKLR